MILPAVNVNAMTEAGCPPSGVVTIPAEPLTNAARANGAESR